MGIASPILRFLNERKVFVVILKRYYCGCQKVEQRQKGTDHSLPDRCPTHDSPWFTIETIDADNVQERPSDFTAP